ncbi:hypothetical protein JTB14_027884 [Gonioctena quinquepunctata]|nr:hypothetical protein JTB14_027884 [Gonioctena quinquepunctata]
MPSIFGYLGQLDFHLMPLEEISSDILTSSREFTLPLSFCSAPIKFVPLSDLISFDCLRQHIKRLMVRIVELVSTDAATPLCTALVRHVKKPPYGLSLLRPTEIVNGPKKSLPTYVKRYLTPIYLVEGDLFQELMAYISRLCNRGALKHFLTACRI